LLTLIKNNKMEGNTKPSLLKSTMNYGIMLGLGLVIYTLLLWMFDATTHQSLGYVSFVITIVGIILATRTYRDQEQGGYITYGRAVSVGTLTVLFAGVITSVFTWLLYAVIDPGLIDKTHAMMEQAYYDAGMSYEQIDIAMNMAKRFANPVMMGVMGFVSSVFFGFLFSLVTSIFLKKEGDPFESEYS
jgi:putative exporter of polyketide antibiotics